MVPSKTLKVKSLIDDLPANEGYLIAYSGGADSTALLHLFASIENVRAIHINHGIQSQAQIWQDHCQATCKQLNIPLIIEQAELPNHSENACRKARYAIFEQHLRSHEILLTAHHAQDQAETVLLKLMRGTGIKGLCGIEKLRKFTKGYIARPLLNYSPQILKDYLIANKVNWIEDTSNQDNNYKRNFIRNEIIPKLESNFPNAIENINRSTKNIRQSLDLLNHQVDFHGKNLSVKQLKELPVSLQTTFLYHWLVLKNLPAPDNLALGQITHDFINAAIDKNPHYRNSYYQLYRWQEAIYCIQNFNKIDSQQEYQWNTKIPFQFPNNCGTIEYTGKEHINLVIKFNQKGQKLKTHKHQFNKSTKQLFQENKTPTWERQNTPFIYQINKLISLGHDWSHHQDYKGSFLIAFKNFHCKTLIV
ncbi:MAG: tRNA lysidine(34) synthetase TilS [Proteobacteria bacterium]|nr:tRNA lysidine(34) synthetase TilS [Pseudomonadota bacterium]